MSICHRLCIISDFWAFDNLWGVINDTLQSNRRSKSQSEFIFGNRIIRDSDEIANHFNDYFINISRTLSQQIQPVHSFDYYLNCNVTSKFQFHSVSQDYIGKMIDNLKTKQAKDMTIYLIF